MKKIYMFSLCFGIVTAANAQYDLTLTMDNYTNLQATSDDPLDLSFVISNPGIDIPIGDSIYWALTDGTSYYATDDLAQGYVMYTKLSAIFATGASSSISVAPIDMAWVYDNVGLTADLCVIILGVNWNAATPPTMLNPLGDGGCVNYTVTEVAGIGGNESVAISVYPNPAVNEINFQVGNNKVDLIKVYDVTGREVASVQVTSALETINTENFESGVYFYQLLNEGGVVKSDKFTVAK